MLRDKRFWIGVAVGTVVGPMVLGKIAPSVRARIPS